ncbi:hypothetical protein BDZ45DRAFT_811450 [Acephala macrosclerotiorum]|nr:hypothetical protein BDZ45DRAFT_811450 [Acephala macrosclerotiorum]
MVNDQKNPDIWKEFHKIHEAGWHGKAKPVWKCNHCAAGKGEFAENATAFKGHLLKCPQYLKYMDKAKRDNSITKTKALYMGGLAFRTFHAIWMRRFLFNLSYETWEPPTAVDYSVKYLDQAYNKVRRVVDGTLASLVATGQKLHFILDESTDRRSRRMINLSAVLKPFGSFFLQNKDSKDAKLGAQYFMDWFKSETKP